MTSPAPLVAVVLLAFLVGAMLPVLYQLYCILRRARVLLDTAGPGLERAIAQVGRAADRVDGIAATFEAGSRPLRPLIAAASGLGQLIDRSGEWLRMAMSAGGAVGPAVKAGVRAFFVGADDRPGTEESPARRLHS